MDPVLEPPLAAYLERLNPPANVARFYRVALEGPDLFDQVAVVRQWGRIGSRGGQELRTYHPDLAEAARAAERVIASKRRKGYQDGPLPPPARPERPDPADHGLVEVTPALWAFLTGLAADRRASC